MPKLANEIRQTWTIGNYQGTCLLGEPLGIQSSTINHNLDASLVCQLQSLLNAIPRGWEIARVFTAVVIFGVAGQVDLFRTRCQISEWTS